jgi:lipoprotein-releasing system permease protein
MQLRVLLGRRFAFSRQNRHRSTNIRIAAGLALCLFAIASVLAFMQALQRNQFEDIRNLESFDLQVPLSTYDLSEAREIARRIEGVDGVDSAFVWADIPAIVQTSGAETISGRIRGIDAAGRFLEVVTPWRGTLLEEGKLASSYTNNALASLDGEVTVTYLKRGRQATVVPTSRKIPIGSLYYTPSFEFDHSTFLTTMETLQLFNPDAQLVIGIYATGDIEWVAQRLKILGYGGVETYRQIHAALYGAMELEQKMMAAMLFLMIVVIIVHIHSSTRRLMLAKQREIAMLRSMGMTKDAIQATFLFQSALTTCIGLAGGVALSCLLVALYPMLAPMIYRRLHTTLTLSIRAWEMAAIVTLTFALSIGASYLATHRLLQADIMEMFGYDEIN